MRRRLPAAGSASGSRAVGAIATEVESSPAGHTSEAPLGPPD